MAFIYLRQMFHFKDDKYVWGVIDDEYLWGVVLVKWVEEGRRSSLWILEAVCAETTDQTKR